MNRENVEKIYKILNSKIDKLNGYREIKNFNLIGEIRKFAASKEEEDFLYENLLHNKEAKRLGCASIYTELVELKK